MSQVSLDEIQTTGYRWSDQVLDDNEVEERASALNVTADVVRAVNRIAVALEGAVERCRRCWGDGWDDGENGVCQSCSGTGRAR